VKYTTEQLKNWARKFIEECAADLDYMGVGEQFEDEWADLPEDEFGKVQRAVHDLACAATVTVSWPDSITEEERLAEILWDARRAVLKTGERLPFADVSERIQEQYRQYAAKVAERLDPDRADELERLRAELAKRCSCDGDPIECSHEAARGQAEAERDQARAEAARRLEHLRAAFPRHFTPNVIGQRLCGCDGQWPCLEQARLAEQVQRVRGRHRPDENGECTGCPESYEPCSTIRALDGTEPAQPDPRTIALEQLADRYSEAFAELLTSAKTRITKEA
jgi:hypothetical protein